MRRETHSPRTSAAVIVLVVVAAVAVAAGIEVVLHLLGAAPLLVSPEAAAGQVQELPGLPQGAVVAGGALTAVAGAALVWLAVGPGRRPRHELRGFPSAVVADNGVIASAVAERVRRELDLARGAVVVGVGHRSADVSAKPEPGQTIDRVRMRSAAEAALTEFDLAPRVRVRARVLRVAEREVQE
ncbi:DNA/RNA endonuclease G [Leucobacter zeae]|nr:DNA/RNA endonuclease G [Leucobacter zeae]